MLLKQALVGCSLALSVSIAACSQDDSDTYNNRKIQIKSIKRQYQNWSTGGTTRYREHQLSISGKAIDGPDLIKRLPAEQAKKLRSGFPIIQDSVNIGNDDWLLMVVDGSGGDPHVLRLHAPADAVIAELLPVPGKIQYHWFNDARNPGWLRVVTETDTVLLRKQPFKQVNLGAGELLALELSTDGDAEKTTAFLAVEYGADAPAFRAVALDSGQELAKLALNPNCFALPAFHFNYPLTADYSNPSTDTAINFADAPNWFNAHVRFEPGTPARLSLKPEQRLRERESKRIAIAAPEIDLGPQPRTVEQANSGNISAPVLRPYHGSDDVVSHVPADCSKLNPFGASNPDKASSGMAQLVSAVSFCTEQWPVPEAEKKERCIGKTERATLSKGKRIQVNEVRMRYRPNKQGEPIPIRIPELIVDGESFRFVTDRYGDQHEVREVFVLAPDDILVKARSDGAYSLSRLFTSDAGAPQLMHLETLPYPASPFSATKNGAWVYVRSAGALVRNQPFMMQRWRNLAVIKSDWLLSWYIKQHDRDQYGQLVIAASRFTDDGNAITAFELTFPTPCRRDDDRFWEFAVPAVNATLEQSAAWFERNFEFTDTPNPLIRVRSDHALRIRAENCKPFSKVS